MSNEKLVLDVCCGSRMFWFNKNNPLAVYADKRSEVLEMSDGRVVEVAPDIIADFTNLPFIDGSFKLVVFDPPHDMYAGKKSRTSAKYGNLNAVTWREDLKKGFEECMRVLSSNGVLIFKWNEMRISTREILDIIEVEPLFGHISGKASRTHWLTFIKA